MKSLAIAAILAATLPRESQERWVPNEKWLKYPRYLNRPIGGYVTKKATAIAIGRAIIEEKYDEKIRKGDEPYDAKRFGDVWVVYGYKKVEDLGGTITVQISASTGTVINVYAEQ